MNHKDSSYSSPTEVDAVRAWDVSYVLYLTTDNHVKLKTSRFVTHKSIAKALEGTIVTSIKFRTYPRYQKLREGLSQNYNLLKDLLHDRNKPFRAALVTVGCLELAIIRILEATSSEDMDEVSNLARDLTDLFLWEDTPEGFDYWDALDDKVTEILTSKEINYV